MEQKHKERCKKPHPDLPDILCENESGHDSPSLPRDQKTKCKASRESYNRRVEYIEWNAIR